jgi:serralysin
LLFFIFFLQTVSKISGKNLVWSAADSEGDGEIFLYKGKKTIQLTDNNVDDFSPQISGKNILWSSGSFYVFRKYYVGEIFLDNAQDVIRLNDNSNLNTSPVISDNNVAWSGNDSDGDRQVFYYNGKKTIQISKKEHHSQSHFRDSEEKVAWNMNSGKSNDVGMLGDDKSNIQLAEQPCLWGNANDPDPTCDMDKRDDYSLQISGNNLVWEIGGNLFFYNGRETVSIDDLDKDVHGDSVQISGDNVVWTADDPEGYEKVFFHNGEKTIQLTDNSVSEYSPQVSGDNVVWLGGNEPFKREIFLYDGSKTVQITKNTELANVSPQMD